MLKNHINYVSRKNDEITQFFIKKDPLYWTFGIRRNHTNLQDKVVDGLEMPKKRQK